MQTLKDFYDEQVDILKAERDEKVDKIAIINNELNVLRQRCMESEKKSEGLEEERNRAREEEEGSREKLMKERQKIDEVYREMALLREEWQEKLDQKSHLINTVREENQVMKNQVSAKEN